MLKHLFTNILKTLGLYHFLQGGFRNILFYFNRFRLRIQFASLKGEGFLCNSCGERYQKFADDFPAAENADAISKNNVIAGYGTDIICPNCLSNARERLVIAMLQHHFDITLKKILHLSPEKNIFHYLKNKAAVVTADLHPGFYKNIDKHIRKEDALAFSFPDESFDIVIANHVLEHIPDDNKAMREIFRVLKKGGNAVLQIPYSTSISHTIEEPSIENPKRQSVLFGQKDHVRIYQLADYISRLEKAGFKVVQHSYESLSSFHIYAIQQGEVFLEIKKTD